MTALISFFAGVALGAVFSPFWLMLWNNFVMPFLNRFKKETPPNDDDTR